MVWEKTMLVLSENNGRVAGTIKFDASVPLSRLKEIAEGIEALGNPDQWVDLHIRMAGDDGTHYIGLHYVLDDPSKETRDAADKKLFKYLRDELGTKSDGRPKSVHGWSLGSVLI
jgi:FAD/FMN-containing dehydrogenase